jgi:hypothetical protein
MVKVVLCRFIKSQLTGLSLINAFRNAQDVKEPPGLRKANVRAKNIVKALSKGLRDGGDGSASTCTFGFVLQTVLDNEAATERELEALLDHFHARFARTPISEAEVIAARGYTGPLYVKMNASLRFASNKFGKQEHLKGNSYTNLIYSCSSLLRKFSEICIIPLGRKVYRGMSGVKLPACFIECEEGGGRGGVDFGFLSTTTNMEVAVSYLGGKAMPVLFEFDVSDIDRGASLSFLSQYPNEDEVLIPPLSYLEVIGEPFFLHTDKGDVTVYPARINCNLKSQTIEEIKGHRQKEILAMLPYLDDALRRDVTVFGNVLAAYLGKEGKKQEKLKELQAKIFSDFSTLSADQAMPEKMSWLNQDCNYKQAIFQLIDFKNDSLTTLVKELLAPQYLQSPFSTALHVAAREGLPDKIVEALLASGASTDAHDRPCDQTALIIAAFNCNLEMVDLLISAKADLEARDCDQWTALIIAARDGHVDVAELLISAKADVHARNVDSWASLHFAARDGRADLVRMLVAAGADVNRRTGDFARAGDHLHDNWCAGKTPLSLAMSLNHGEVADILRNAGAQEVEDH